MLRTASLLLTTAFLTAACGQHATVPAQADFGTIKRMAVVVTGDTPFRVVAESAEGVGRKGAAGRALGAAVGGLLGYTIATSIVAAQAESRDTQIANDLLVHLNGFTPHRMLAEAFVRALNQGGAPFEVAILDRTPAPDVGYDAIAEFRIEQWGLRRPVVDEPEQLATFVKLKARITRPTSDNPIWSDSDTTFGHGRHPLATYGALDGDALRTELRAVAADSGHRMATRILHTKAASE